MAVLPSDRTPVAAWLVESLFPFERYVAGSVVPPGFEAYARVLHPVLVAHGEPAVRWSAVAAWSGRIYHPRMQFEAIATPAPGGGAGPKPWQGAEPWYLPSSQVALLGGVVQRFTATPEDIWYCVWEGYGAVVPATAARVRRPHRNYRLYNGPLTGVADVPVGGRLHPNYWFPADRAWCVASDVDLYWTYVGGTRACVEAVLAEVGLEAVPAALDGSLTPDSDPVDRGP